MKIETFEQTEVVGGTLEDESSPEALKLIEDLGLTGQRKMTSKTDADVVVRCPYRAMTARENRVHECLYPKKIDVDSYQESMIPLRVLQVIAHAKSLNIYRNLQVWCEEGKPVDPVLVGVFHVGPYEHNTTDHILARWGDALDSFETLYEKAKVITMQRQKMMCLNAEQQCATIKATLESTATKFLDGGWVNIPS